MELKVKIKIPQACTDELQELIEKIEELEKEHSCHCTLLEVEIEG